MQHRPINDLNYKASRVVVVGMTGTGKSTLAARFIHLHPATLVLIYDWQGGEFGQRLGAELAESRQEFADKITEGHRIVCYDAEKAEEDPEGEGFLWFCDFAFEVAGFTPGIKIIVIDDVQDLDVTVNKMPRCFKKILTRSRRRKTDTLIMGTSANALNNHIRDQVTDVYHFRSNSEAALEFAKGMNMDVDEIKSLPDTEFVHRDCRTGEQNRLALWKKESTPKDET